MTLHEQIFSFSIYHSSRCCCGQDRATHQILAGIDIGVLGDVWLPHKHTRAHPTDAYGTLEFQGSAHPTKAQVSTLIGLFFSQRKNIIDISFCYLFFSTSIKKFSIS